LHTIEVVTGFVLVEWEYILTMGGMKGNMEWRSPLCPCAVCF